MNELIIGTGIKNIELLFALTTIFTIFLSWFLGVKFIGFLKNKKFVQPIYDEAPDVHKIKQGTPTMGGITFLIPMIILFIILFYIDEYSNSASSILFILVIFGFGLIGFKDDYLKVINMKNQSGLSATKKLILQFIVSFLICFNLYNMNLESGLLSIFNNMEFLYLIIIVIAMVGFSNATNFTDGLDGLLTSISIIVFSTLLLISFDQQEPYISLFIVIIISGLIGFLINNKYPAKIFMGDTGSLTIGALFTLCIILLKIEVLGLLIGSIYILEILSVVIQVIYFKYTKRKSGIGKRVFLMAPLHHHFEKKGLTEKRVVLKLCLFQLIVSTLSIFIYFN